MRMVILMVVVMAGCAESVRPGESFFTVGPEPVSRGVAYDYCAQIGGTLAHEADALPALAALRDADFDGEQSSGWFADVDESGVHVLFRQIAWDGTVSGERHGALALPMCEITPH